MVGVEVLAPVLARLLKYMRCISCFLVSHMDGTGEGVGVGVVGVFAGVQGGGRVGVGAAAASFFARLRARKRRRIVCLLVSHGVARGVVIVIDGGGGVDVVAALAFCVVVGVAVVGVVGNDVIEVVVDSLEVSQSCLRHASSMLVAVVVSLGCCRGVLVVSVVVGVGGLA